MSDSLRTLDNLIGACSYPDANTPGFRVPQGLDRNIGFVDMSKDPDGRIRRHLFTFPADPNCPATYSIATVAAAKYLRRTPEALISMLPKLNGKTHPAAYQQANERDSLLFPKYYAHLLIHYRSTPIPMILPSYSRNSHRG